MYNDPSLDSTRNTSRTLLSEITTYEQDVVQERRTIVKKQEPTAKTSRFDCQPRIWFSIKRVTIKG